VQPSPRHHPADHSPVPVVNRDASRSFAGRDNGGHARHVEADRAGLPDSAGRRHVAPHLWPDGRNLRRSKCGRDRSGCRSPPGRDSVRKETAAPGWGRPDRTGRAADDGRGNSCDTDPACVPGTVWCTVPKRDLAVGPRHRARRLSCNSSYVCTSQLDPAPPRTAKLRLPLALTHIGGTTPLPSPAANERQASRQG